MSPGENAVERWNNQAMPHDDTENAIERRKGEIQADIPDTDELRAADNDGIPSVGGV